MKKSNIIINKKTVLLILVSGVLLISGCASTEFNDINQAIAFEKQVKGWSRKKKEAIINDRWEDLKNLSECLNETSHKYYNKKDV